MFDEQDTIVTMNSLVVTDCSLAELEKCLRDYEASFHGSPKDDISVKIEPFEGSTSAFVLNIKGVAAYHFIGLCYALKTKMAFFTNEQGCRYAISTCDDAELLFGQREDGVKVKIFVPTIDMCETVDGCNLEPDYKEVERLLTNVEGSDVRRWTNEEPVTLTLQLERPLHNEYFGNRSFIINCEKDEVWDRGSAEEKEEDFWDLKKVLQLAAAVACGLALSEIIYMFVL